MYAPRMRAKHHELAALATGAADLASHNALLPVLEPVSMPDSTFVTRLQALYSEGLQCDLVLNPSVGKMTHPNDWLTLGDFYVSSGLLGHHNLAVLSHAAANHAGMAQWIRRMRQEVPAFEVDLVHEANLSTTLQGHTYAGIRYNFGEDRTVPASYGLPLSGQPVMWVSDPFPGLARNVDYLGRPEGVFSTRASSYRSQGYAGVSDFLIVGERYVTGGGPAYAVVIHLTYRVGNDARIRHFCSDTNDTQVDPAGKFLEALNKCVAFVNQASLPSNPGIDAFRSLHSRQHYPGLGKVKEHAIVNHMYVMEELAR